MHYFSLIKDEWKWFGRYCHLQAWMLIHVKVFTREALFVTVRLVNPSLRDVCQVTALSAPGQISGSRIMFDYKAGGPSTHDAALIWQREENIVSLGVCTVHWSVMTLFWPAQYGVVERFLLPNVAVHEDGRKKKRWLWSAMKSLILGHLQKILRTFSVGVFVEEVYFSLNWCLEFSKAVWTP